MKYAEVITVALEDDRQLAEPGYSITANSHTYWQKYARYVETKQNKPVLTIDVNK